MGHLVNGLWQQIDVRQGTENDKGEFLRKPMSFRESIKDGQLLEEVKERYHLYVSYACPWAHRTLIMRSLKKLNDLITVSVVSPIMEEEGWTFHHDYDDRPKDHLFGSSYLREVYLKAESNFTGRVTVPVLWDIGLTQKAKNIYEKDPIQLFKILMN